MVTKEQMEMYEDIRSEGLTNMFAINNVIALSDGILDRESILDIMKNYSKYMEEFGIERR